MKFLIFVLTLSFIHTASGLPTQITNDGRYVFYETSCPRYNQYMIGGCSLGYRKDVLSGDLIFVDSPRGGEDGTYTIGSTQITNDGRYVVFHSNSEFFESSGGASSWQIYRKDLQTGALTLVSSLDGSKAQKGNGDSLNPQITEDGRYVVFQSDSTNLISGSNGLQIYIKDLQTGALSLVNSPFDDPNILNFEPKFAGNGRYVLFSARHRLGRFGNAFYLKDLHTGALSRIVHTNESRYVYYAPKITEDGRYLVYVARLIDPNQRFNRNYFQVYRKDLQTGTEVVVSSPNGSWNQRGNRHSEVPQISDDGRYVVFHSNSSNFVARPNFKTQVYIKDMQTGALSLVSHFDDNVSTESPQITGDGRYVVLTHRLNYGIDGIDIYRKDLQTGELINVARLK